MNKALLTASLLAACGLALAKLPPPDDAAKAKAAEAAAKSAWQGKIDAYLLCKAQDKVAAAYRKSAAAKPAVGAGVTPVVAKAALTGASGTTVAAAVPAAKPATPPAAAATPPAGTTVASATPAPCSDPGPFAYNQPAQKPLETSGAHSPAGTAASPPSVRQNSAEMAPAKPATAGSKKP